MQVRHRLRLRVLQVASAPRPAGAAAGDHDRQVGVVVHVRVAHAAAVQVERMVQQRAVAVRRRGQLLQEVAEQRDVVLVDLGDHGELRRIVPVVRRRVVRIRHADLGVRPVARLAGELERDDAGHVALQRQELQVEHQLRVVGVGGRHADRAVEIRQRVVHRLRLGPLDAALHLAHGVEILADPGAVGGAELPLQAGDVLAHPVEQARPAPQGGAPVRGAAPFAEQALEDDARVRLGRQRGRGRRPRQVVLVDAGVAVVALPHHVHQVHRQLQRRQARLLPDLPRRDLIDRRPQVVVAALGPLRGGRAQERGVRGGVRARIGVPQLQVGQDGELVPHRGQRAEARRQLRQRAAPARRGPARDVRAHRDVDEAEPPHRAGRGLRQGRHRRRHRIEQGQRDGGAHAPQERPPRQGLLRDDHDAFLIRNGMLLTTSVTSDENR